MLRRLAGLAWQRWARPVAVSFNDAGKVEIIAPGKPGATAAFSTAPARAPSCDGRFPLLVPS